MPPLPRPRVEAAPVVAPVVAELPAPVDCGGAKLHAAMTGELARPCAVGARCPRALTLEMTNCTDEALEILHFQVHLEPGGTEGFHYDFANGVLPIPPQTHRAFPYAWSWGDAYWRPGVYTIRVEATPSRREGEPTAEEPSSPPLEANATFEITSEPPP